VSFLFSLIFIYLLGYTFNFMVMFGMLLGLGMLIDGAIVVTEYADRKMTEGLRPPRRLCHGGQTHVLAGDRIGSHHPGGFPAADVLAGVAREVHALPAGHGVHGADRFAGLRAAVRPGARLAVRQSRAPGRQAPWRR
jgi:hypothetical protein